MGTVQTRSVIGVCEYSGFKADRDSRRLNGVQYGTRKLPRGNPAATGRDEEMDDPYWTFMDPGNKCVSFPITKF